EPDAGNTPQRIVGLLMKTYHEAFGTGLNVTGHEDGASVTNATSKKPGDITIEKANGDILQVFEVTVKPFSKQRMRESYETVRIYDKYSGSKIVEVTVICDKINCHPDVKTP